MAATVLCIVVAVVYLAVFFTLLPTFGQVADDPTPLFAVLAGTYVVGAILLLSRDNVVVEWVGMIVQVVLLAAYLSLTVVGDIEHPDPSAAIPFSVRFLPHGVIAATAQVLLIGVLAYLALSRPRQLAAERLGPQGHAA
ncbi:MAG TPA: hypothetical protein VLS51_04345 [Propionibacteriaceae bacterium]|nr:hypothetical protein [Propionibacteriaceae bacterium]